MFAVRIVKPLYGLELDDSIVASPILGSRFALIRMIPARYSHLMRLDNAGALEYVAGGMYSGEVERLLTTHFRTLQARARGMQLLR